MQPVVRYLRERFGAAGAQTLEEADGSLVVYHVAEWTSRDTRDLLARFPDAEVDLRACRESLSGFVVAVRRSGRPRLLASAAVFGCLLAGALYVLARLG